MIMIKCKKRARHGLIFDWHRLVINK
jgi:hypothetical protein